MTCGNFKSNYIISFFTWESFLNESMVKTWTLSIIFSWFPWELIVPPFFLQSMCFIRVVSSPTKPHVLENICTAQLESVSP